MRTVFCFVAALPACGSPDDSKPEIEYGLRNQDWDGDGYDRPEDCNDSDPESFPGAGERCNGLDDDCDAAIDEDIATAYYRDRDGDAFGALGESFDICWAPDGYVESSGDCDDTDAAISPAATELCDLDRSDEDCNGLVNEADPGVVGTQLAYVDADHDGFGIGVADQVQCYLLPGLAAVGGDCDDTSAARNPFESEVCDAGDVDEDCDGLADDLDPKVPGRRSAGSSTPTATATAIPRRDPSGSVQARRPNTFRTDSTATTAIRPRTRTTTRSATTGSTTTATGCPTTAGPFPRSPWRPQI